MSKSPRKIMLVDDNPMEHRVCESFLRSDGYTLVSCWTGAECLEMAGEEQPDLILMDVILTDGDGKAIAASLQQDPRTRHIPIIFTTNTVDIRTDKGYEAFEIHGQLFRAFAKPLHKRKILSVIRKEINRAENGGTLPSEVEKKRSGPQEQG